MKIYCKQLGSSGNEITLSSITEETTISEIKKQIEEQLQIPGNN